MSKIAKSLWRELKVGDLVTLWEIMASTRSIDGAHFFELVQSFMFSVTSTDLTSKGVKFNDVTFNSGVLEDALSFCEFFGLNVAYRMISSNLNLVKTEGKVLTAPESYALVMAMRSELEGFSFIAIDPSKTVYWDESKKIISEEISPKFPESIYDFMEGQRCFSVHRYTACVFHLMRGMESVVKTIASHLDATVVDKHGKTLAWGVILSNLKNEIDKMQIGEDRDKWYLAHSYLHTANVSFRTPTAHPKATYTEEEALAVINSVTVCLPSLAALIP